MKRTPIQLLAQVLACMENDIPVEPGCALHIEIAEAFQEPAALTQLLRVGDTETLSLVADSAMVSDGNAVKTAALVGVSHRTLCRWMREFPAVREAVASARPVKTS